jgi:acyl carrier protein
MNRTEIYEHLRAAIVDLFGIPADAVTLDATFREDLDLDSIDAIDLLARLHELTGRRLELAALKRMRTVSDAVDVIAEHLSLER